MVLSTYNNTIVALLILNLNIVIFLCEIVNQNIISNEFKFNNQSNNNVASEVT